MTGMTPTRVSETVTGYHLVSKAHLFLPEVGPSLRRASLSNNVLNQPFCSTFNYHFQSRVRIASRLYQLDLISAVFSPEALAAFSAADFPALRRLILGTLYLGSRGAQSSRLYEKLARKFGAQLVFLALLSADAPQDDEVRVHALLASYYPQLLSLYIEGSVSSITALQRLGAPQLETVELHLFILFTRAPLTESQAAERAKCTTKMAAELSVGICDEWPLFARLMTLKLPSAMNLTAAARQRLQNRETETKIKLTSASGVGGILEYVSIFDEQRFCGAQGLADGLRIARYRVLCIGQSYECFHAFIRDRLKRSEMTDQVGMVNGWRLDLGEGV